MKIELSKIDNNPFRNMKRNPVDPAAVQVLLDSFERNGIWPNVVVRKHPKKTGRYQLAYGHHRLAAMKKCKVASHDFIVQKIDEWGMYTAMVDENEGQKRMTPELIYENIEQGINYIEPIVKQCETLEKFGLTVPVGTVKTKPQDYARVRNAVLAGEGLGVSFLQHVLPGEKSTRRDNIQAVVDTHYAVTKAKAKQKRAQAKRKAASAAKDTAEAERLEKEAARLEEAATKAAAGGVDRDILLSFESTYQMTQFASSVKSLKIPPKYHQEAAQYIKEEGITGAGSRGEGKVRKALNNWWFVRSGKAAKERAESKRQAFKRKHREKDLNEFAGELIAKLKDIKKQVDSVKPFASAISNPRTKTSLQKVALDLELALNELGAALQEQDETEIENNVAYFPGRAG